MKFIESPGRSDRSSAKDGRTAALGMRSASNSSLGSAANHQGYSSRSSSASPRPPLPPFPVFHEPLETPPPRPAAATPSPPPLFLNATTMTHLPDHARTHNKSSSSSSLPSGGDSPMHCKGFH